MKKPLFLLVAFVAMSSIFTACQKEELATPNNSENETYFKAPSATGATWSNPGGSCSGDDVTVQFCVDGAPNCGNVQIQQLIAGTWVQVVGPTSPAGGCVSYTMTSSANGTYDFRARWVSSGAGCSGANTGWVLGSVTVAPCVGCEDTFTAACSLGGCGTYTVTYTLIAAQDGPIVIQGGLSNGAVICSADGGGLTRNTTHPSIGGKASVTRWEGNVEACVPVTVTISYNGGSATTGDWSAKRDGVALGGNHAASCANN